MSLSFCTCCANAALDLAGMCSDEGANKCVQVGARRAVWAAGTREVKACRKEVARVWRGWVIFRVCDDGSGVETVRVKG